MKEFKLILLYSSRLVLREWKRFTLPFLSLTITTLVVFLVLVLTASSGLFLSNQAKELLGGDIVVESDSAIDIDTVWQEAGLSPQKVSTQIDFNASLQSSSETMAASFLVVDNLYPLYGTTTLKSGEYKLATANQIYLDKAGSEKLGVTVGDPITFGDVKYTVAGIVAEEPTSLFSGFRFLPRVIMSSEGFLRSGLDTSLLRAEWSYYALFDEATPINPERLLEQAKANIFSVDVAGETSSGFQRGLTQVSRFLIITVLITSVLAAVNVYASTLYLVSILRRSFAVLIALGLRRRTLVSVLASALGYVVVASVIVGAALSLLAFNLLVNFIYTNYSIALPSPDFIFYGLISLALILAIVAGSFTPAVLGLFKVSPKKILVDGDSLDEDKVPVKNFVINTLITMTPLFFLAVFLLKDLVSGLLVMTSIVLVYAFVSFIFFVLLSFVYKIRHGFGFSIRTIISQKKADGLFGIVSFTSLFVALAALASLLLIQTSLERFLVDDLSRTAPTTYVIDIQPSQKDSVLSQFSDLTLFANIPSRIIDIDGVRIQELLATNDEGVDRELGREFNLTFRNNLIESETISAGSEIVGRPGEISVDEEFATRANIKLNSQMTFLIQGFEVSGVVTSLRSTDSRSGLPFFYFVMAPEDIAMFPSVNFGYAYYDEERQAELSRFLATNMPNVTVIETQALGPIILRLVGTLMALIFVIAVPPLVIATILIATLVVMSYSARRRDGARFRALGATTSKVMWLYLFETTSLTFFSSFFAYATGVAVTYVVSHYFLELGSSAVFNFELIFGLCFIVALVTLIGLYLFKSDNMPLRELLAYEENY
jgi:putative ABC transport system permease protein